MSITITIAEENITLAIAEENITLTLAEGASLDAVNDAVATHAADHDAHGALVEADIPAAIARDAEVTAAVSIHAGLETGVHGLPTVDYLDFPEGAAPASPDADKLRVFAVADADFTVLETITDLGVVNRICQDTFRVARNTSGAPIAAAQAVRFTGSTGNKPNFSLAVANSEATMPAVGMTTAVVADNKFGEVMIVGRLTKVKTNYPGWAEGQQLYVDPTTPGALTNVRPTHPNLAQWVGTIEVVHANNGIILVNCQSLTGVEDGTNRNSYTIGDTLTGIKSLKFNGLNDSELQWDSALQRWRLYSGSFYVGANTIAALTDAQKLIAWTESGAYEMTARTYNGTYPTVLASATVKWPDGSAGVLTVTQTNTTWLEEDAYTITHVASGLTVTQAAVTRDANGMITVKPALTVA